MEAPGDRATSPSRERLCAAELRPRGGPRRRAAHRLPRRPAPRAARGRPARAPSRHLASRHAVEAILLDGVPDSLALRASIVIGARSRSFRLLVRLVERMPLLALPAWQRFRTQPIDQRDVIEMLAARGRSPRSAVRSLDIGGPDVLTYGEMMSASPTRMLVGRPAVRLRG